MSYSTLVAHLYETAFDRIGVPVTVTPPGGSEVVTQGVIRRDAEVESEGARAVGLATLIRLPVADVGTPVRDTAISDGTDTWYVDAVARRTQQMVEVVVRA